MPGAVNNRTKKGILMYKSSGSFHMYCISQEDYEGCVMKEPCFVVVLFPIFCSCGTWHLMWPSTCALISVPSQCVRRVNENLR